MKRLLSSLSRTAALFAIALMASFALAQNTEEVEFTVEQKTELLENMEAILTNMAFVPGADFKLWPDMIAKFEEPLAESENPAAFAMIINRALREFGFSHILLFSPQAATRRRTNEIVGIGVRIQIEEVGIRVTRVFEGGAAIDADVHVGDLIFEADGEKLDTTAMLTGKEGEPVTIKLDRDGEIIEKVLVRKRYSTIIPAELFWPEENVAHLIVPTFDSPYRSSQIKELMKQAEDAELLILDVRGNGGGRVANLRHLSSYFLTYEQPLGTFIDRRAIDKFEEETGETVYEVTQVADWYDRKLTPMRRNFAPFQGEVAVLIDRATGSASEMIAAALKEQRGSKVIGMPSAGAVLASVMQPLKHGFLIQVPMMDYVTIKGFRIEGNGITPDVIAGPKRFGEKDIGVSEAIRIFKEKHDGKKAA